MNVRPHVFVINWPGVSENARVIESALLARCTVLNTDPVADGLGWVQQPPDAFYAARWNKALELLDGNVLGIICADVTCRSWDRLLARAKQAFAAMPNLAIYAPNVSYSYWIASPTQLHSVGDGLFEVPITDGMCWFLRSDLVSEIGPVDLSLNTLGWGIDLVAPALAAINGWQVVRDYRVSVEHPQSCGYNQAQANHEASVYLNRFQPYVQEKVRELRERGHQLRLNSLAEPHERRSIRR